MPTPITAAKVLLTCLVICTLSWLGMSPGVTTIVTPSWPSVNPFFAAICLAVVNAMLPVFSGMNTAPASDGRVGRLLHVRAFAVPARDVDGPAGEPEQHGHQERDPDEDRSGLAGPLGARPRGVPPVHGAQTEVGTGSKRKTEWSVSVTFVPKNLVTNGWSIFT